MENNQSKPAGRKTNLRLSTLAVANVIMMAGTSKATDSTDTAASGTTSTATPAKTAPAKSVTTTAAANSSSPASTTLNEVVVTAQPQGSYQTQSSGNGKYTSPLLDTAQTITVVPQALIKDQNATSLRDVLKNVPGVTFGAGEGQTFAGDNFTIRGFNAQEDVFVDGFRDTGVYNRDPFNLQQVEVVKGPASAYSGHGSTGGYVNLISKAPTMDPHYEFDTGYGTNQYYRETLDINQPMTGFIANAAFRLNAVYQYNNFADLDYIYNSRWGANPVFSFGLDTDSTLTVGYFFLQEQDLPSFGLPVVNSAAVAANPNLTGDLNHVAPVNYSNFYGLVNRDYENTTTQIPTVNFVHTFDEDFKLSNTARYENTLRQSLATPPRFDAITATSPTFLPPNYTTSLPNGIAPPAGLVTREYRERHQTDTLVGDQAEFTGNFKTWKFEHTMTTDLEYTSQEEDFKTYNGANIASSLYDPQALNSYPFSTSLLGPETRTGLDDASFSLFDSIKLTDQWILAGGMRYDHLEENTHIDATLGTPATPSAPVAIAASPAAALHRTDDLASWRVSLDYKPLPNGTIYFGYGTSYNPTIEGGQDSASPDGLATNTVNLPPEEDETYEFGTKWDVLNEKLSLTSAVFLTNKNNARITDPTSPAGTTVFALAGKQRVEGFELGAQGNLTRDWKVFAGYSYLQSEVVSGPPSSFPGSHLPNTPNQTVNLWTTYELPFHLTLGGGVNFIDKRYGTVNNTSVADGFWTGQLMAAYKVNEHLSLQCNVYNLWDTTYIEAVGSNFTPGAGRSVVVSAEIEF